MKVETKFELDLAQSILEPISDKNILSKIIDPTTGKPYDGIIFKGEFASLNVLNNNNRIYIPENYIPLIQQMRKVIFGTRGLYGHLEHGKGYANDYNLCSHKILDIWYDEKQQKVFGTIMLLNTPTGKIAQEIYKSGGRFAISGRGGGTETTNPDGSITALLKLLVTFDIVYHPGFTTAEQIGCSLMESIYNYGGGQDDMQQLFESYAVNFGNDIIPNKEVNPLFESFNSLHNFGTGFKPTYLGEQNVNLFESQQQQTTDDIQKLQDAQVPNQQQVQDELQDAVEQELDESADIFKKNKARGFKNLGASVYDDSAGFVTNGLAVNINEEAIADLTRGDNEFPNVNA